MSSTMHTYWTNINFTPRPMLGLCNSDAELEYARSTLSPGDQLLTRNQALAVEPALKGNKTLTGALLKRGCFTMDPYLVCKAYADRAEKKGVRFYYGVKVNDMKKSDNGKYLLQADDGITIEADVLLLAAGALDGDLAKKLGHNVAVRPLHGQMFATQLPRNLPSLDHMLFSYEGPLYYRTAGNGSNTTLDPITLERKTNHFYGLQSSIDGVCKFGGDRIEGDRDSIVYEKGLNDTRQVLGKLLPVFDKCEPIGLGWGGSMPFTPDNNIIVGELEKGLHVVTGAPFTKGAAAGLLSALDISERHGNTEWLNQIPSYGTPIPQIKSYLTQCSPRRFDKRPLPPPPAPKK